ncbi:hypothetical protein DXT99_00780 [Pontibacter diazotrophicus]|uniref:Uncharacterized protein n=2 Tax=Pontibacter diazotrophicus TaxID=1400979 RepID=A0A3D8LI15_9BACT|nr:hypothetical protein DXT99_00780 [Pontibacter diazotrophicus]
MDEAILRAHQSTEKENQPQDKLFSMKNPDQSSYMNNTHQAPLNESHINLMHSWMNLRGMDNQLAETKYSDLNQKNAS